MELIQKCAAVFDVKFHIEIVLHILHLFTQQSVRATMKLKCYQINSEQLLFFVNKYSHKYQVVFTQINICK